ncbi:MAG: Ni/Fe-hydrogenase, b-type cytochrome subunit [Nitrospinota bacterium]
MAKSWISPQKRQIFFVRNVTTRVIHWVMFVAITILMLTGYYIGDPTFFYGQGEAYNQTVMADIRLIHFVAAIVMSVSLLLRLYLAFFSNFNRDWFELMPTKDRLTGAKDIFKSYFNFKTPPFYYHTDPLDGLIFLAFFIIGMLQIGTGFALYAAGLSLDYWWGSLLRIATLPIYWILGTDQNIRLVHHLFLWVMLGGVITHVYMQVAKTLIWRDGHIAAIFGGFKFRNVK